MLNFINDADKSLRTTVVSNDGDIKRWRHQTMETSNDGDIKSF